MRKLCDLLSFVPPNFSSDAAVLLIDSPEFLAGVREKMPNARIFQLALEDALPVEPKIFDVIISGKCLTFARDCYWNLLELNRLLKDSGFLLTQFLNVRFVGVLENLKRGAFPAGEKRFWAKRDVVKILDDATFKEIRFLPGERAEISTAAWEEFGFDNFSEDLSTRVWLVKACRCTAEVAALKEVYTPEVRAELSRLIHRVEYGIDAEKNLQALVELCRREKIFSEYLADFVEQVTVHAAAAKFILAAVDKSV